MFTTIVLSSPQPAELFNIIINLNPNKAGGYDNISSYLLRLGAVILAPILSVYFELALELGMFPQIFKTVKVIPIHKFCAKLVQNYRPISLLPYLSKILEKVIKNMLITFFQNIELYMTISTVSKKTHSVIHALLDVLLFSYDAIQKSIV